MPVNQASPDPVEYYFSFISLWSYVGSVEFRKITEQRGIKVIFKPIDLMAVFAAGGGKPVKERPAQRQAYRLVEMQRWRALREIPLVLHPKFYPVDPSLAHRVLLAAIERHLDVSDFVHSGLKAVWADELNIAEAATIIRLADKSGLPGSQLMDEALTATRLKSQEQALTREAINRQIFGAPFYFYRDEAFWGQDRLDLLANVIDSGRRSIPLPDLTNPPL